MTYRPYEIEETLHQAYRVGYRAALDGQEIVNAPNKNSETWRRGWFDGYKARETEAAYEASTEYFNRYIAGDR